MNEKQISPTRADFKHTWQLYKENYKAYISTILFALISFILFVSIVFLVFYLINNIYIQPEGIDAQGNPIARTSDYYYASAIGRIVLITIAFTIFLAFLNCQYGLSYDIMSSGDMFAEFKSSKTYFKKKWWQYILGMIFMNIVTFLMIAVVHFFYSVNSATITYSVAGDVIFYILLLFINLIWFLYIINYFPSITSQGNLKNAFIESTRIFKNNFKRLLATWSVYFLIFYIPMIGLIILNMFFNYIIIDIITYVFAFVFLFVGYPMMTLIATGLYNNTKFERFKPLNPEKQAEYTIKQ